MSANVAQFFADKTAAFRAISAAMAPSGLMATTFQPRNAHASADDAMSMATTLKQALTDAGFVDLRLEVLPLRPAPAICVLARKLG
jgi:hypothetical protein